MKLQLKTLLTSSFLLLAATQAATAGSLSSVTIQDVKYAGNACPGGSAEIVLAADKQSATVAFDEYIVEAGGPGQRTFVRKKCDIAFGLKVPSGYSVTLLDADYRGFVDLPRRAKATFAREYFFAGKRGPKFKETWKGETSDDFFVRDELGVISYSPCGQDVILRSKTATTVRTRRGNEAMAAVDSIDLASRTLYRYNFGWKKCSK